MGIENLFAGDAFGKLPLRSDRTTKHSAEDPNLAAISLTWNFEIVNCVERA
jgi:hypothetical protein